MLENLRILAGVALGMVGAVLVFWVVSGDRPHRRERLQPAAPLLASEETIVGERIAYPTATPAKVTAAVVTIGPGQETGWHTHGMPTLGYVIEGELEVDYGDKGVRTYRAGEALLEAISVPHNGHNRGRTPVRLLAVFMGAEGLQTSSPARR